MVSYSRQRQDCDPCPVLSPLTRRKESLPVTTPLFDLSEFETFEGAGRKRSTPGFAIQARGALSANAAAFDEMGRPEFVVLMFNPKRQQIAIKAADKRAATAVKMRPSGKGSGAMASARAFLEAYGLSHENYRPLEIVALSEGLAVLQVPGEQGEDK